MLKLKQHGRSSPRSRQARRGKGAYTNAVSVKPDYADAYNNMGAALQDYGKLEDAIQAYTKALSIKPVFAEAHNNMGNAIKDQGKLEEEIAVSPKL